MVTWFLGQKCNVSSNCKSEDNVFTELQTVTVKILFSLVKISCAKRKSLFNPDTVLDLRD
jgi:hypothetical protein